MPRVFLSYRRQDNTSLAVRVFEKLEGHFGADEVFMDIDSIPPGVDFRKHIDLGVSRCDVCVVLIGPRWAGDDGKRIHDSRDFVRLEVESALKRDIPVIPLLIDNTPMPAESDLPASLAEFSYRSGLTIDQGRNFKHDVDRLIRGIERVVKGGEAKAGFSGMKAGDRKVLTLKGQEIAFRWCPPGSFKMGDERVDVTLTQGFWMAETETTQGLWKAVGGPTLDWSFAAGPKFPVFNVSHSEAEQFATRLTEQLRQAGQLREGWKLALPTEAQWEYAARAGTTTSYGFGDDETKLGDHAWFRENSGGKPHEVGTRQANPWGLHDMLGNVWEWCADGWDAKLPGGVDPQVPSGAPIRVDRGGGWDSGARSCRAAHRYGLTPGIRNDNLGFRVAAGLSEP